MDNPMLDSREPFLSQFREYEGFYDDFVCEDSEVFDTDLEQDSDPYPEDSDEEFFGSDNPK